MTGFRSLHEARLVTSSSQDSTSTWSTCDNATLALSDLFVSSDMLMLKQPTKAPSQVRKAARPEPGAHEPRRSLCFAHIRQVDFFDSPSDS